MAIISHDRRQGQNSPSQPTDFRGPAHKQMLDAKKQRTVKNSKALMSSVCGTFGIFKYHLIQT